MVVIARLRLPLFLVLAALTALLSGVGSTAAMGAFAATDDLGTPRSGHSAILLGDDRVLVSGGFSGDSPTASTEIYDIAAGTFSPGPDMSVARSGHHLVPLPDGTVLILGGWTGTTATASVDLFDPASDTITPAAPMLGTRSNPGATLLVDGTVLVAGGSDDFNTGDPIASVELYDRATDAFTSVPALSTPRALHTASLLRDGSVLFFGGDALAGGSAELYDLSLASAPVRRHR